MPVFFGNGAAFPFSGFRQLSGTKVIPDLVGDDAAFSGNLRNKSEALARGTWNFAPGEFLITLQVLLAM